MTELPAFINMTIFWLIMLFVFIIFEALTVHLVSIWFAFGSLCALISSVLGAEIWLQVILFIVFSAVSLILTRPLVKKYILPKRVATNYEQAIGKTAIVTEQIDNVAAKGAVKINGTEWTARSSDGSVIGIGSEVTVVSIEGVKAIVKPGNEINTQK
jgi:membrane protein implicated in regulation of membrane protease activity